MSREEIYIKYTDLQRVKFIGDNKHKILTKNYYFYSKINIENPSKNEYMTLKKSGSVTSILIFHKETGIKLHLDSFSIIQMMVDLYHSERPCAEELLRNLYKYLNGKFNEMKITIDTEEFTIRSIEPPSKNVSILTKADISVEVIDLCMVLNLLLEKERYKSEDAALDEICKYILLFEVFALNNLDLKPFLRSYGIRTHRLNIPRNIKLVNSFGQRKMQVDSKKFLELVN